ncbi:cell division protein ZipA [Maricurvus nonylphenolicus]|uniref:cell division protein ZipA n=1 Tax=Maricurvus nonylphenolicus TaxID=1008307 RepID=UPI0036F3C248
MDFAMREWLTVIIVLLIVGVLLDGWRRMRQSRRDSIKMSLSMHKGIDKADLENYGSELPNGGARVVASRDEDEARELTKSLQENFEETQGLKPAKPRIPEQVALNLEDLGLEEEVPMLMESVVQDTSDAEEPIQEDTAERDLIAEGIADPIAEDPLMEGVEEDRVEPVITAEPVAESTAPREVDSASEAEEVIILNVMAREGQRMAGNALLEVLLECGMRYGDMQIFHFHQQENGEGPILFSLANMVVPGTFDLSAMDNFATPGVSLFLTLPVAGSSMQAFDAMLHTAQSLCDNLGAELKDENRSVMTGQTIEHCRQRISEFERKQLSRAPA